MNKRLYIPIPKSLFGSRISSGISLCTLEASIYASCASSEGLGIEHKKCESEFKSLLSCLKTHNS